MRMIFEQIWNTQFGLSSFLLILLFIVIGLFLLGVVCFSIGYYIKLGSLYGEGKYFDAATEWAEFSDEEWEQIFNEMHRIQNANENKRRESKRR